MTKTSQQLYIELRDAPHGQPYAAGAAALVSVLVQLAIANADTVEEALQFSDALREDVKRGIVKQWQLNQARKSMASGEARGCA